MSKTRKPRRLADTYTFPGFRPLAYVQGIFGDPQARLVTLVRRTKKQSAARVARRIGLGTTADNGASGTLGFVEGLNNKIRVIQSRAYGLHGGNERRSLITRKRPNKVSALPS
jgi:hypothetical protein